MMKVFVGNLSDETNKDDLRKAFESFGQVRSVTIVRDGITHKSRGFGFVIMPSVNEARNAIEKINGKDLRGQKISAEKARTKRKPRVGRQRRSDFNIGGRTDKGKRRSSGGRRGRRHH
jgi:RNA recognition motif-containing protein